MEVDESNDDEDGDDEYEDVYVSVVFPPQVGSFDTRNGSLNTVASTVNGVTNSMNSNAGTDSKISSTTLQDSIEYKSSSLNSVLPNKLRISGLSEQKPLFQTRNNVLMGEWSKLVGSELVFNENGEYIAQVDGQILLKHGRLVEESGDKTPLLTRALQRAKELEDLNEVTNK